MLRRLCLRRVLSGVRRRSGGGGRKRGAGHGPAQRAKGLHGGRVELQAGVLEEEGAGVTHYGVARPIHHTRSVEAELWLLLVLLACAAAGVLRRARTHVSERKESIGDALHS